MRQDSHVFEQHNNSKQETKKLYFSISLFSSGQNRRTQLHIVGRVYRISNAMSRFFMILNHFHKKALHSETISSIIPAKNSITSPIAFEIRCTSCTVGFCELTFNFVRIETKRTNPNRAQLSRNETIRPPTGPHGSRNTPPPSHKATPRGNPTSTAPPYRTA